MLYRSLNTWVCQKKLSECDHCTWKPPISAAPGAAGPPSLPSPPQTRVSSPPAPCAEPPGSSSSARDAAEAAERHRKEETVSAFSSVFLQFTIPTNQSEKRQAFKQIALQLNQRASLCCNIFFFLVLVKRKTTKQRAKCSAHLTNTKQGRMLGQKKRLEVNIKFMRGET